MPKTLDQLIREAKEALNKTNKDTPEYTAAIARVEALTSVQQAGITKTQDDLNRLDRQVKEGYENSIKETLGMTLGEFEQVVASVEESLPADEGAETGGGEGEGNVLQRVQATIQQQGQQIEAANKNNTNLSRSLYSERVENNLRRAFEKLEVGEGDEKRKVSLKDGRFDMVRRLAGEDELIQKAMNGEALDAGAYAERVQSVYAGMPEVFESDEQEKDQGLRIKNNGESPGIPATPAPQASPALTDADRLAASASPFR